MDSQAPGGSLSPAAERRRISSLVANDLSGLRPGEQRAWWLREALEADPGEACPPLAVEAAADVVIIGGGFTGLWTAWWLLEHAPGTNVTILEGDIVGGGASGRNGGFLTSWWDLLPALVGAYGEAGGLAAAQALDGVADQVGAWCRHHEVDAWYVPGGMLVVSSSPAQDGAWGPTIDLARRLGAGDRVVELSGAELQARCASPALRSGILLPGEASVQPARLARGLRQVLLARGVVIHEHTRATGIREEAGGVRVTTATGGSVRAGRAVLALNAWAAGWPGGFGARMITWSSYIVLTEPIPDRLAALGWTGGEAITDSRFTNHYFRTTADGRIAFGGGGGRAGYGGRLGRWVTDDRGSVALAARGFRRLFPMLDDVALVDAWGGAIDITPSHLPAFGSMGESGGIHWGHGYSGSGVGPAWLGGQVLAALAQDRLDDPAVRLPMVGRRDRRFPPEPFRFLGARLIREAIVAQEQREDEGRPVPAPVRWLTRLPRRMGYQLGPE